MQWFEREPVVNEMIEQAGSEHTPAHRSTKKSVKHPGRQGCATLKLSSLPARLPIILKFATQVAAPEGNDGIGPAHGPEHA